MLFLYHAGQFKNHVNLNLSKELRFLRLIGYFCKCVKTQEDITSALIYLRLVPLDSAASRDDVMSIKLLVENDGKLSTDDDCLDFRILQAVFQSQLSLQTFHVNQKDDIVLPAKFDEVNAISDRIRAIETKLVGIINTTNSSCIGVGLVKQNVFQTDFIHFNSQHEVLLLTPMTLPSTNTFCLHAYSPTTPPELLSCPIYSNSSFFSHTKSQIKASQPSSLLNSYNSKSRRKHIPRRKNT